MPANAGPHIEKYLAPFREALNSNAGTSQLADVNTGYSWCGVFLHWCCRQAGLALPLQPPGQPATFALVRTWRLWAQAGGAQWFGPAHMPLRGDIVVFRNLSRPWREDCHIGVVVGTSGKTLRSAEGNVVFGAHGEGRRTQVKRRLRRSGRIVGYIRLHEDRA